MVDKCFSGSATYTSVCTEKPTAVSSACSCFRSIEATATTTVRSPSLLAPYQKPSSILFPQYSPDPAATTNTLPPHLSQTTALPTPTQCSAANNYGYAYAYNAFSFKSQYIFFNEYSTSKPGDCCAKCYATPSCYSFSEIYGPSGQYCELGTIAAGTWPDVSTQCPLGRATGPFAGNLTPEPQGATSGANLGPCGAG